MFGRDFVNTVGDRINKFYDSTDGKGVVILWGATATGKTGLSVQLSDLFPLSVVSSDSRQIFRLMDIGTDKVSAGYRAHIPHYQIDIVNPDEHYTAGQWKYDTTNHINQILSQGRRPFVVGGTGLYIDTIYKNFAMPDAPPDYALRKQLYNKESEIPGILRKELNDIDPEQALIHHPHSLRYIVRALEIFHKTGKPKSFFMQRHEPKRPLLLLGLWRSKTDTNKKINERVAQMIDDGLINETQFLLDQGYSPILQSMQGIGYKQTIDYLHNHYDKEQLVYDIKKATHRLAKKQRSRFRRYRADAVGNTFSSIEYEIYELS